MEMLRLHLLWHQSHMQEYDVGVIDAFQCGQVCLLVLLVIRIAADCDKRVR